MAGKSIEEQLNELTNMAGGSDFEAPAEVRVFAKRVRNLFGALKSEGMEPMEISQMLCIPMLVHLNDPDAMKGE